MLAANMAAADIQGAQELARQVIFPIGNTSETF